MTRQTTPRGTAPRTLLKPDSANRLLPLIVMVMVFLAMVTLSAALTLSLAIGQWNTTLTGMLTVQVPPVTGTPDAARESEARAERLAAVLREVSGVKEVTVVSERATDALLAPWLDESLDVGLLPLPRLIDVTLNEASPEQIAAVERAATGLLPDAVVDSHRVWLSRFVDLARQLEVIAMAGVAFVTLATATSVSFSTRASLAVQEDVVDTLHLIGAYDGTIAGQFARHVFRASLKGAVAGAVLGLGALVLVISGAGAVESGLLPAVAFRFTDWLLILAVPLTAAGLATVTAYLTVRRQLGRWR